MGCTLASGSLIDWSLSRTVSHEQRTCSRREEFQVAVSLRVPAPAVLSLVGVLAVQAVLGWLSLAPAAAAPLPTPTLSAH